MRKAVNLLALSGILLLLVLLIGCDKSPLDSPADNSAFKTDAQLTPADGQVQLMARVTITEQNRLMLMIEGCPDTVIANENCQIVRLNGFSEAPIPFSEIRKGDSVQVTGSQNQYRYVYANQIRVCQDSGAVRYAARVEMVNRERLMLTFEGKPDSVIANRNCQITRLNGNEEAPVPFSEIHPGDSVGFYGERTQSGYIYAKRLQICTPGDGGYEVAIRAEITGIDYAANTFTVAERAETITVDENTVIWTVTVNLGEGNVDQGSRQQDGQALSGGDHYRNETFTVVPFADLKVGDVIELRANVVDEATLYAAKIKLTADCQSICVTFSSYIASIDIDTRIVTYQDQAWISAVCPGAKIYSLDGADITLADLAVGDYVSVKGYPLDETNLKTSLIAVIAAP